MDLERYDLFVRVVVGTLSWKSSDPVTNQFLRGYEADASNGHLGYFEIPYYCACLMVLDIHRAIIESTDEPRLSGMEMDTLDVITPQEKFALAEQNVGLLTMRATRHVYVDSQERRSRGRCQIVAHLCLPP